MQRKQENRATKSLGDLAVDGMLHGLAAGAIMLASLLVIGLLDGAAPATVLARFGLPDGGTAVTGLLGHLAVSEVLGLVWGVLYGGLLQRVPAPAWLLGVGYGLVLYAGAALFVASATGLAAFASWQLLVAHVAYGAVEWAGGALRRCVSNANTIECARTGVIPHLQSGAGADSRSLVGHCVSHSDDGRSPGRFRCPGRHA